MEEDIQILENLIRFHLSPTICNDNIIFVFNGENRNDNPFIKLYDNINGACIESDNFKWYLLDDVIELNLNREIPFHNCLKRECKVEGYVVSLKVKEYDNENSKPDYRYSKINKLEIIYK